MIKIKTCLLLFALFPLILVGQNNKLQGFENLVNKTWIADGEWSNGTKFKQEVSYSFDLKHTIVIVNSKGFTNQEQTEYGNRNHGVRKYNLEEDKIEFWEFDVFGGLTKGTVKIKGKDLWYNYKYGGSIVTDCWQYIDNNTYRFTVGSYKDGNWEAKYLQTDFKLKNE